MTPENAKQEMIKLRIEATRDAQARTRLALLVGTFAFLTLVTVGWNAYFSWTRNSSESINRANMARPLDNSRVSRMVGENLAEWVRSRWVTFSLIGIRISVDDAVPIGALALYLTAIWTYFSIRRENSAIGLLLKDTLAEPWEVRQWVFHGIVSFAIFSNIGAPKQPISSTTAPIDDDPTSYFGAMFWVFVHLPFITIASYMSIDASSLLMHSPFSDDGTRLAWALSASDWRMLLTWYALGATLAALTLLACRRSWACARATEQVLTEYLAALRRDGRGA